MLHTSLLLFQTPCTSYDWETDCLQCSDSDAQVTENPAYGLSSKNWLEKDVSNDGQVTPEVLSMESSDNSEENVNCDKPDESLISNFPLGITASQEEQDCDANTVPKMNDVNFQSHFQQNKMESKPKQADDTNEMSKHAYCNDLKHGKLTWSVLRHRQLSGDILKNCDNKNSSVIDHSTSVTNHHVDSQDKSMDPTFMLKAKKNIKDRSFPLSLMRPIAKISDKKPDTFSQHFNHISKNDLSRQRPVQRNAREKFQNPSINKQVDSSKGLSNDVLGLNNNPLSEIAQIKTEESIQEWLARIGESANGAWPDDSEDKDVKEELPHRSPWSLANNTDEEKDISRHKPRNCHSDTDESLLNKSPHHPSEKPRSREKLCCDDLTPKREEVDTASVLCNASKASPANVPMVVMQCSRLHSHIGCKPPFQQTSLPMGTLVTALYQESDWLYVQTPHGIEGFVSSSNCVPIGTVNEPTHTSRRPWEPCDFPIQISLRKKHEFGRQQGSYIPAKLPTNNGKQAAPYVSTVKMKTNFYSDRYFSHTFKSKDSIKTAKTVTDILRSSPETKVSNQ